MALTLTQLREEVKYTAKHIGLNLISIPWVTATIYWLSSWFPVSSGTIVGLASISLAIMFPLFFSGAVFREKLLGIHELLWCCLLPSQLGFQFHPSQS